MAEQRPVLTYELGQSRASRKLSVRVRRALSILCGIAIGHPRNDYAHALQSWRFDQPRRLKRQINNVLQLRNEISTQIFGDLCAAHTLAQSRGLEYMTTLRRSTGSDFHGV